jgi:hypothetical protein
LGKITEDAFKKNAYIQQQRLKQANRSHELFQMVSHVAKDLMGFIVKAFEDKLGLQDTKAVVCGYLRQFITSIQYMKSLEEKRMYQDYTRNLNVYQYGNPVIEWDGAGVLVFALE